MRFPIRQRQKDRKPFRFKIQSRHFIDFRIVMRQGFCEPPQPARDGNHTFFLKKIHLRHSFIF